MTTVPSMRPDSPRILSTPSPERQELQDDWGSLYTTIDRMADEFAATAYDRLMQENGMQHVGGPSKEDRDYCRACIKEAIEEVANDAIVWLENRLEETK